MSSLMIIGIGLSLFVAVVALANLSESELPKSDINKKSGDIE